jgi:hypothetical protein
MLADSGRSLKGDRRARSNSSREDSMSMSGVRNWTLRQP